MTLILETSLGIVLGFILLGLLRTIGAVIVFVFVAAVVLGSCALLIWGAMRLTGTHSVGEFFEGVAICVAIGIVVTAFQTLYQRWFKGSRQGRAVEGAGTAEPKGERRSR